MIKLSRCVRHRLSLSVLSTPRAQHRGLSASNFPNSKNKTEVPVASYTRSKQSGANAAERTTLTVDESQHTPTPVAGDDVGRKAVAFDRSIVSKMTPTMKRFTLEGKVAVVTGSVPLGLYEHLVQVLLYLSALTLLRYFPFHVMSSCDYIASSLHITKKGHCEIVIRRSGCLKGYSYESVNWLIYIFTSLTKPRSHTEVPEAWGGTWPKHSPKPAPKPSLSWT